LIKTVTLLTRRPDLSPEQFQEHWRDVHGPLVWKLPGVRRYVQSVPVHIPGHNPPYDGMAEVWYEDLDALRNAASSQACKDLLADEVNFMGPATEESIFYIVEEVEIEAGS
jgi:uncharacterized protein (TIGR02118 family)